MAHSTAPLLLGLLAFILAIVLQEARASDIGVDGQPPASDSWRVTNYGALDVTQGTVVEFSWTSGVHGVAQVASSSALGNCDLGSSTEQAAVASSGTYSLDTTSTPAGSSLYFACQVHCNSGMKVSFKSASDGLDRY
jgi:plastocyanin